MERYEEDPAIPSVSMSATYLATFFVIALLAFGAFLLVDITGTLIPEIVGTVDKPASELSPH
jgi:hypothetical protein